MGTHWWNPPHLIPLVEVVRTVDTRQDVIDRTVALLRDAGKVPVVVHRDVTGFIGNRLNQAMWREALALIEAGVCDAETIDIVVKSSFGLRLPVLGPMENADLIGLELTRNLHALLFPDLSDAKTASPLLDDAIARGDTGLSAGAGLRRWTPGDAEAVRRRLAAHLIASTRPTSLSGTVVTVHRVLSSCSMNLALDVGEFLLQVPGRVLHALVVDGRTEMAHEEVDEAFARGRRSAARRTRPRNGAVAPRAARRGVRATGGCAEATLEACLRIPALGRPRIAELYRTGCLPGAR